MYFLDISCIVASCTAVPKGWSFTAIIWPSHVLLHYTVICTSCVTLIMLLIFFCHYYGSLLDVIHFHWLILFQTICM